MPDTFLGLLILLAAAAPGAVYVRTVERYVPQRELSQLREVAELALIGSASTLLSIAVVILGASAVQRVSPSTLNEIELQRLVDTPVSYLLGNWLAALLVLLAAALTLGLGCLIAWGGARLIVRKESRRIFPHFTTWYSAIGRWMDSHYVFTTVELKDGRLYSGWAGSVPNTESEGGLILKRPVFRRLSRDEEEKRLDDLDYLVIPLGEVRVAGLEMTKKEERSS